MTDVIHIRNAPSGFLKQDGVQFGKHVYIGRPGRFGNPIARGAICPICNRIHNIAGDTLICYEKYLLRRLHNDCTFKDDILSLEDKILVCYCAPNPCHGEIIKKIIMQIK